MYEETEQECIWRNFTWNGKSMLLSFPIFLGLSFSTYLIGFNLSFMILSTLILIPFYFILLIIHSYRVHKCKKIFWENKQLFFIQFESENIRSESLFSVKEDGIIPILKERDYLLKLHDPLRIDFRFAGDSITLNEICISFIKECPFFEVNEDSEDPERFLPIKRKGFRFMINEKRILSFYLWDNLLSEFTDGSGEVNREVSTRLLKNNSCIALFEQFAEPLDKFVFLLRDTKQMNEMIEQTKRRENTDFYLKRYHYLRRRYGTMYKIYMSDEFIDENIK